MAEQSPPKRGEAYTFAVGLVNQSDTDTFVATPTLAGGDIQISKDGGQFANIATATTLLDLASGADSGILLITLTAAEMTADRVVVLFHDAAGDEWQDCVVTIDTVSKRISDLNDIAAGAAMTLASGAITAAVIATGAIDADAIAADAIGASELAADAAAEIAAANWSYSSRTLTQSAASVISTVVGSTITITRGDTLSAALTNIGALTGYVSLDFTVKEDKSDTDANAILRIRKNASGVDDGLLRANKAAATATDGSITITDEPTGDITIALAATVTDDLVPQMGLYYDIQLITATAVTTLSSGTCNITADVTAAVV